MECAENDFEARGKMTSWRVWYNKARAAEEADVESEIPFNPHAIGSPENPYVAGDDVHVCIYGRQMNRRFRHLMLHFRIKNPRLRLRVRGRCIPLSSFRD